MRHHKLLLGAALLAGLTAPVQAQQERQIYSIEEQELGAALRAFSVASGWDVIADAALVAGKRSHVLRGRYEPGTALARLLQRTGLRAEIVDGAFVIRPDAGSAAGNASDIVVVGTRIRGGA